MKILTWNCNGAFRRKFKEIAVFDADIIAKISRLIVLSMSIDSFIKSGVLAKQELREMKNGGRSAEKPVATLL